MAKAKKTESASTDAKAPAKKPAAKKASGGKSAAKPAAAPAGLPMIDTDLAAASAAQMLLARKNLTAGAPAPSSGVVDRLKQDAAKPQKALNSLFHSTAPKQAGHSHLPHQQQHQSARAQTKGADVARANVPRRTAG
jgi:hypothetical protein